MPWHYFEGGKSVYTLLKEGREPGLVRLLDSTVDMSVKGTKYINKSIKRLLGYASKTDDAPMKADKYLAKKEV